MLDVAIFALVLAAAPPAATAATPSSNAPAAHASASAPDNTKITAEDEKVTCKEEATTGSMIADRVCHTNAQWRQMREDAQEEIRENHNAGKAPG